MKKVLFIATVVKTHIMEFHTPYLQMFKEQGWETAVAAQNDYENPADCNIPFCDRYYDIPFARSPLDTSNLQAYQQLKKLIEDEQFDIIHCHTPVGGALGRLAARKVRKQGVRVIYTAHGFHFYKGAPLLNWLIYYPIEKWLSRYTDTLITINQEDYAAAQKFHAKQVRYVHGVGIDVQKFKVEIDREEKRRELGLREGDFALLTVGELIPRKNYEVVLQALGNLKKHNQLQNIQYLICGRGVLREKLEALAQELYISDCVRFLGYRNDIPEICAACDLFVFMSKQEGLPVALMEAMAAGLPCICSEIRGNTDLLRDGESGQMVSSTPHAVAEAIAKLLERKELSKEYAQNALNEVDKYNLQLVKQAMYDIYFQSADHQK